MALQWTNILQCDEEVVRKASLLLAAWGFTLGWDGPLTYQGAVLKERYDDVAVQTKQILWSDVPIRIIVGMRIGKTFGMNSCACPEQYVRERNNLPGAPYSDKAGTLFALRKEGGGGQARAYTYSPMRTCLLISRFGTATFIDEHDGTCGDWFPTAVEATAPKAPAPPRPDHWRFLDEW